MGILSSFKEALVSPTRLFQDIQARKPWKEAFLIVLTATAISAALAALLNLKLSVQYGGEGVNIAGEIELVRRVQVVATITQPIASFLAMALAGHASAAMLGGYEDMVASLSLTGYGHVPIVVGKILQIPYLVAASPVGIEITSSNLTEATIDWIEGLATFYSATALTAARLIDMAFSAWGFLLLSWGFKRVHRLSTSRIIVIAIFILIGGWVVSVYLRAALFYFLR